MSGYAASAALGSSVTGANFSLDLVSETTIKFYLTTDMELTADNISVSASDPETTYEYTVVKSGKEYCVNVTGISAHELASVFTVSLTDGTVIQGSALSWAQSALTYGGTTQKVKNLAAALYEYYIATMNYRNGN